MLCLFLSTYSYLKQLDFPGPSTSERMKEKDPVQGSHLPPLATLNCLIRSIAKVPPWGVTLFRSSVPALTAFGFFISYIKGPNSCLQGHPQLAFWKPSPLDPVGTSCTFLPCLSQRSHTCAVVPTVGSTQDLALFSEWLFAGDYWDLPPPAPSSLPIFHPQHSIGLPSSTTLPLNVRC